LIVQRWRVIRKLGEGGCGTVYQVEEEKTREKAALKAEPNSTDDSGVLKLEAHVRLYYDSLIYISLDIEKVERKEVCGTAN
jgi:serine/threonine protein kinase